MFFKKRNIQCINCGNYGHTSKYCNYPTTSCGVICFKIVPNVEKMNIKYVMVQRKDSLNYVEFIRGKYSIQNISYIIQMFENMTFDEIEKIKKHNFEYLWNDLWMDNKRKISEFNATCAKFNLIKNGYYVSIGSIILDFDLDYILSKCKSCREEPEWDFPKGRRKIGEKDLMCAQREFSEESGIRNENIQFIEPIKQYEEIYQGLNKIRYKNIYYLGKYLKNDINTEFFDSNNLDQIKEVQDVKWFTPEDVINKLKTRNVEKHEIFKRIHNLLIKKF